ncbi:MAG: hypothetical protein II312_05645 [Lachnospiraceae bacterium]|nr:hypothetical protein [Lachnospiraceae bacterium]
MKKFDNFQSALKNLKDIYSYNEAIAIDIINQTKNKYYDMFIQLSHTIENNWI